MFKFEKGTHSESKENFKNENSNNLVKKSFALSGCHSPPETAHYKPQVQLSLAAELVGDSEVAEVVHLDL